MDRATAGRFSKLNHMGLFFSNWYVINTVTRESTNALTEIIM
jgi:hypothetical protein